MYNFVFCLLYAPYTFYCNSVNGRSMSHSSLYTHCKDYSQTYSRHLIYICWIAGIVNQWTHIKDSRNSFWSVKVCKFGKERLWSVSFDFVTLLTLLQIIFSTLLGTLISVSSAKWRRLNLVISDIPWRDNFWVNMFC